MKSSQILSKAKTFLLGKFIEEKKNKNARRIKAFKLGFRYRMITDNDERLLSDLLNEILQHCKDPAVAKAFAEGELTITIAIERTLVVVVFLFGFIFLNERSDLKRRIISSILCVAGAFLVATK